MNSLTATGLVVAVVTRHLFPNRDGSEVSA